MGNSQEVVDYITDQMAEAGSIRSRAMFGGHTIYCDDKVVALVCDDQLFMKQTDAGRAMLENVDEAPAYPGAKLSFRISGDFWEDREYLGQLVKTTADALPPPKKKKKTASK